jgi:hypothetical protein
MRRITSIILALAFIIVSVTGIQMEIVQDGLKVESKSLMVQQEIINDKNNDTIIVVSAAKLFYPREVHKFFGYLFIVTGLIHLKLNMRPLLFYLKHKR